MIGGSDRLSDWFHLQAGREPIDRMFQKILLGRSGSMRDIGLLAVFLASDAARYITGQTILIDGGRGAR